MQDYTNINKKNEQNYRTSLRSSSQFLNLHILRTSLSNYNYSPVPLAVPSMPAFSMSPGKAANQAYQMRRFSNLHMLKHHSGQEFGHDHHAYAKLRNTLQTLQNKIAKAQKILNESNSGTTICNHKAKKQKQVMEQQIMEPSLLDLDEISTKKNDQNDKQFNNQSKISDISKQETIKTLKIKSPLNYESSISAFIKNSKKYYINSLLTMNNPKSDPRVKQHVNLSFQIFSKLSNNEFEAPEHKQLQMYKINIPWKNDKNGKSDKKTLLLDIDDTILNCDDQKKEGVKYDLEMNIEGDDNVDFPVYIKLRPYALTFLKNISSAYEIIAFTGSIEKYAKKVIQQIDPDDEIFSYKLYRDSCIQLCSGVYAKDIRIVNRRPQNIVLVDNSPYSYIYQLQNGVPILPYEQGPDEELPKLQKYLLSLAKQKDVRQVNKNYFKFHKYAEYTNVNQMIAGLYQG